MALDKLSLDEMVQGRNTDKDDWEALISDPERELVWSEAVKRRENLDRFCHFAAKWPQFVCYYQQAKRFVKQSTNAPKIYLKNEQGPFGDLSLTLNDKGGAKVPLLVTVEWGSQQLVEVQGEQTISFNTESKVKIHYRYMDSVGWITSDDEWEFSPDEGAVMLTVIDGDVKNDVLSEHLSGADSVGYVVLLPSLK